MVTLHSQLQCANRIDDDPTGPPVLCMLRQLPRGLIVSGIEHGNACSTGDVVVGRCLVHVPLRWGTVCPGEEMS